MTGTMTGTARRARTVTGLLAGVAALGAAPPATAQPAQTNEPARTTETVEHCVARALTAAEVEAGATVDITCSPEAPLELIGALADVLMAQHFSGTGGTGSTLSIYGPADCTRSVVFAAADTWNDRIKSTVPRSCGSVKHYVNADYSGGNETVTGANTVTNLTTLSGKSSAMKYSP